MRKKPEEIAEKAHELGVKPEEIRIYKEPFNGCRVKVTGMPLKGSILKLKKWLKTA